MTSTQPTHTTWKEGIEMNILLAFFIGWVSSGAATQADYTNYFPLRKSEWTQECTTIDVRTNECTEYTLTRKEAK